MNSDSKDATVLLVGASRGLGHALAAEYIERRSRVVATVRGSGRTALHELADTAGGRLEIEHVDINSPEQVQGLRERLVSRRFDLLFVNAGVANDREETSAQVTTEEFTRLMVTNALSPMRVIQTLGELVPPDGTIAIMSSGSAASPTTPAAAGRSTGPANPPSTSSCAATPRVTTTRNARCSPWRPAGSGPRWADPTPP
jgi:NAD(P)-dependent dehydrogenase (short-subunit alcohol dehydrogenase family)